MKIEYGDLFEKPGYNDGICVTTNGVIKNNGKAVMGAGIALEFDKRFDLAGILGKKIFENGNHAYFLKQALSNTGLYKIFSFPTKEHWKNDADIDLIKRSCHELIELCYKYDVYKCYFPAPGCGCGNLDLKHVIEEISTILDDRFILVLKE